MYLFIHVIFDDGIFIIILLCLNFNSSWILLHGNMLFTNMHLPVHVCE